MDLGYFHLGSTVRAKYPQKTLATLKPYLSEYGITRVADITGLDSLGISTAICVRPNSKHLSVSQGKGLTNELAQVSAIMESLESFHAETPPLPKEQGNYNSLKANYRLLEPKKINSGYFLEPAMNERPFNWVLAKDFVNDADIYIPQDLTCLDTSSQPRPAYGVFNISTNGLAAGNSYYEACCHSLYEIIERHAFSEWRNTANEYKEKTQIKTSTIDNHQALNLIEK